MINQRTVIPHPRQRRIDAPGSARHGYQLRLAGGAARGRKHKGSVGSERVEIARFDSLDVWTVAFVIPDWNSTAVFVDIPYEVESMIAAEPGALVSADQV
jgi:hypothetical protein